MRWGGLSLDYLDIDPLVGEFRVDAHLCSGSDPGTRTGELPIDHQVVGERLMIGQHIEKRVDLFAAVGNVD